MADDLVKRLRGIDGDSMSTKTLDEAADRIEQLERERDALRQAVSFANTVADTAMADMKAAEAALAAAREALVEHNDLLRSALQIAKREGVEGQLGTTNWDAYYNRVVVVLKRHHDRVNEARDALIDGGRT